MVDPAVLRRFSAGAARYESHAHAQRLSAVDLLAYTVASMDPVPNRGQVTTSIEPAPKRGIVDTGGEPAPNGGPALKILEPGCGTGLYTRMLLETFRGASVFGVDISEAMVRVAKRAIDDPRARFAVTDAEEIATGNYDLVTSNAVFQWFLSLPRTLARMASLLPGGGLLTFSFFGPETYAELDAALRGSALLRGARGGERVAAAAFHSREEISGALSAVFPRWDVVERRYHQEFPTLAELLRSIRYTGTGGGGARESWSPGKLARVEEAYREREGGIRTTYQVFLCRGVIPEGGGR
ncbi:MAG: Methyltransferase type 12 [Deltaproteobacteria bacterium]|nr:Methyltransferase type 12 [Deltaproteobacteria bacterium]